MSNWNGKVKCLISYNKTMFTEGKIYDVINGCIKDNSNSIWNNYSKTYSNLDEFHKVNGNLITFKEVKEYKIPVLCELLGVQPNEEFKIKFDNNIMSRFMYHITESGHLNTIDNANKDVHIPELLDGKFSIIKLPFYQFNEDEIITLKALYLNNYYYIARDEDGRLYAYQEEPTKCQYDCEYISDSKYTCKLNDDFFKQVEWGIVLDVKAELSQIN